MPKFYHYTSAYALECLAEEYGDISLRPRNRMIPLFLRSSEIPERTHEGALFGLLEPQPAAWQMSWENQSLLEIVLGDISTGRHKHIMALVEISVDNDTDDIYVADWGVHYDPNYMGVRNGDPSVITRVKKAYAESLVPFHQYNTDLCYKVPEVICFNPIPAERIKVIDIFDSSERTNQLRVLRGAEPIHRGQLPGADTLKKLNDFREQYGLTPVKKATDAMPVTRIPAPLPS